MKLQPFFAVRVVLREVNGSATYSRDYVRGEKRMGVKAFTRFAVGDFIGLVTEDRFSGVRVVSVQVLTPFAVQQNRQYHTTTH